MLKQDSSTYRGFRMPGIRLREPIAPGMEQHVSEKIRSQLYAIHMFDKAHATMLVEEGLIPREPGARLLESLRGMEPKSDELRLQHGGGMHSGEQYLIRMLGEEVGGLIHLGRSSGDLSEVATRLFLRDGLLTVLERTLAFRTVLIEVAQEHVETVMPGYTHAQHAQPTTYGHMLLSWVSVLERDTDRLFETFRHMNRSPAGAAILTGTDFPINRQRVAALLGFDEVERNTFDAILSHDNLFEIQAALSILHMNLARWADDLMLFDTSEFGMIEFPDRFCGTSSIMMQKKNAYAPQYIKGAASETVGGLVTGFLVEKAPTSVPILDRASSRDATERSLDRIARDLTWLSQIMPSLHIRKELMEERAGMFWGQATDLAGAIVREAGINWRSAHQIVGILVRLTEDRGIPPREVTTELIDEAAILYFGNPVKLDQAVIEVSLDPRQCVERRTLYGGPAPAEVRQRIPEYQAALDEDAARLARATTSIAAAKAEQEQAIDRLVG